MLLKTNRKELKEHYTNLVRSLKLVRLALHFLHGQEVVHGCRKKMEAIGFLVPKLQSEMRSGC